MRSSGPVIASNPVARIEAVEGEVSALVRSPVRRHRLDRGGADVHQAHVVAVERLVVAVVDADALGADRVVVRLQHRGGPPGP